MRAHRCERETADVEEPVQLALGGGMSHSGLGVEMQAWVAVSLLRAEATSYTLNRCERANYPLGLMMICLHVGIESFVPTLNNAPLALTAAKGVVQARVKCQSKRGVPFCYAHIRLRRVKVVVQRGKPMGHCILIRR